MIRSSVLLAACLALWSCTSDPTADEAGVPTAIIASPSVVFVTRGESQLIKFGLVDELGGLVPSTWTIGAVPTELVVVLDSAYRVVYNLDGTLSLPDEQSEIRITVTDTSSAIGPLSFTVSASGFTLPITVNVLPSTLYATFSPANPAPGEVVTMTMPPTLRLTPTSTITFPGNLDPVSLTIAADFQSATFISAPTTDTTATVTDVGNTEFPTVVSDELITEARVTGTESGTWTGDLPATLSPLVAGSMTVTLNPAYAFKTSAPASVFTFPNQTPPILSGISADSTVATLSVGPNVESPLTVTHITFKGAPQFEYTLVSADSVISELVESFPATLSSYTPQIGQSITMTAGAGFSFNTALGSVIWGGSTAIVTARTASTITLYPIPGSAGSPTSVSGIIPASAPAFELTIPAALASPLAMQATVAPGLPGSDAFATAPLIGVQGVVDAGTWGGAADCGLPCQVYKITVTAAGPKTFTLTWSNSSDLGLYFLTSSLVYFGAAACDAHGNGGSAQPETCTITFPAAGDYFLEVDNYASFYPGPDPDPTWFALRFN